MHCFSVRGRRFSSATECCRRECRLRHVYARKRRIWTVSSTFQTQRTRAMDRPSGNSQLDQARLRIATLAVNLAKIFSPIDVAGIFAGTAISIVTRAYGREKAEQ